MRLSRLITASLLVAPALAACQSNLSPDTYAVGTVGQVERAAPGVVVSARSVVIGGTQSGVGASTGAIAGAIAGANIGGGRRGNAIGAFGGAVVGLVLGAIAEEALTRQQGTEYIVRLESGHLVTVVQAPSPPFAVNQRVIVIYGAIARLAPHPD